MTIKQFILLVWKNKFFIVLPPILAALGVFLLTSNMPREYESKTIVFTNPSSNQGATDGGVVRMDFYTSNNLFDNLTLLVKSRQTVEEASLRLMAQHLSLSGPEESIIGRDPYSELKSHFSERMWEDLAVVGNEKETYANVKNHYLSFEDSPIEYLLREHDHYAISKIIERLYVSRKSSSDMMEIAYRTNDPGICYHTLRLVTDAFTSRYSDMKEMENINSITYFQNQLVIAQNKLRAAEENLKSFMTQNRILNYYEQGKYLDIAKLEHEQDEERSKRLLSGTEANLNEIESMFENFDKRQVIIQRIGTLQDHIVSKNMEIQGLVAQNARSPRIDRLEEEIENLKNQIDEASSELFQNSNTQNGLQRETILEEWLRLKILFEEQKQALDVMQNRKLYLSEKIEEFAPLGAELKKLEREVSVNEEQYLSILHGLNMAYLNKYDLEMSSSQRLIDEPFFPKTPLPSKRALLTLGGGMATGFIMFSLVLLTFFLDNTIKSGPNAEKVTGLKVAGAWLDENRMENTVDQHKLAQKEIIQFHNNLNKYLPKTGKKIILFYSLKPAEGKTYLIKKLVQDLEKQNREVMYWGMKEDTGKMPCASMAYPDLTSIQGNFEQYWSNKISQTEKEFILWELPNIAEAPLNYSLINQANALVMILDAERKWTQADLHLLNNLKEMVEVPHLIWLNKMKSDELEDIIGEIPKKRSFIRSKVKKLLS
ncbi:lipopolysaccharide biosynthesis protein [Cyclobacterium sp.]|uniref:GumC family protein n=1 Tax=Cyclobacterium sp. TaxID=1966343 RepID=UPI0019891C34|nr:lipopolysaccharide biosynthesis protein [Cyclobacterium sp.]MBD3629452.1 lipopolysaccharide biosynthesis protein [Cyclobacterium sp.]